LIDENTWEIIDLPINKINMDNLPENFNINTADIKIFWTFSK
jgi:hypothetical protein